MMLRQLSYAIKTHLKAPKAPSAVSLWHKCRQREPLWAPLSQKDTAKGKKCLLVPWAVSLWHKRAVQWESEWTSLTGGTMRRRTVSPLGPGARYSAGSGTSSRSRTPPPGPGSSPSSPCSASSSPPSSSPSTPSPPTTTVPTRSSVTSGSLPSLR